MVDVSIDGEYQHEHLGLVPNIRVISDDNVGD